MPKLVYYISHTNIFNNAINNYIPICDDLISFELVEKKNGGRNSTHRNFKCSDEMGKKELQRT